MPEQQRTATNRLADVIDVVLFARQTGVLLIERGTGSTFEEGKVIFVDGQVVQANAQGRSGLAAFNWLNGWGACWFMFVPTNASAVAPFPPSSTPQRPGMGTSPSARGDPPAPSGSLNGTGEKWATPTPSNPPVRIQPVNKVLPFMERLDLTRAHRRLFLLIDGHRDLAELARLMGQGIDEIRKLLNDLERAGLIQQ